MASTLSKAGPSFTSRQAAPMQKRVAPACLGEPRLGEHVVYVEQGLALEPGFLGVMGRLRAIFAVLGAGAGLDREQARKLHLAVFVVAPMYGPRPIDQVEQGESKEAEDLFGVPIVAQVMGRFWLTQALRLLRLAIDRIRAFDDVRHWFCVLIAVDFPPR